MRKYDEYIDSGVEWIGEIPSHWTIKKIKHHSSVNVGLVINPSTYFDDNGTVPIITGKNVQVTGIDLSNVDYITKESNEHLWKTKIFEGDLVSMRVGYPGRTCVVKKEDSGINCCSLIITRKSSSIDSKLLEYQLNSNTGKIQVELCQGGMGQQVVNLSDWNEFVVTTPPLQEQNQIVSYLDTKTALIDALLEKTQRKIELLKEKRTALINEVVTKGLNPNVEMVDSGVEWIGEIPSHWEKKKLKHITKIFGRIGFRGYTTEDIVSEGNGVITISPSNIKNDIFSIENSTYLSWDKYYESPEIQIFPDDIIIVKTGSTIGKTSIIPNDTPEMTINPQLIVLKEIQMNPKYLYYQTVCKYIKESFDVEQTGSTTPTISQEKINGFPILNPPLLEQNEIASYLDEQTQLIDKTIAVEERRIELLKEYRQSLISEVVTGKRKVITHE